MIASAKVRAARKKAQEARLAKKGSKDYSTYYANQPTEKVRAQEEAKIRGARQVHEDAVESLAVAEITGEGLAKAQENVVVTQLVVEKLAAAKRIKSGVSLTAGG